MQSSSKQSEQVTTLDALSAIVWHKKTEPVGTGGYSRYLGVGANDGVVFVAQNGWAYVVQRKSFI